MLGEGIIHHWAGTQGFTHDDIPFVGAVNGRPGNYIIAVNRFFPKKCGEVAHSFSIRVIPGTWTATSAAID